ncbi:MAG: glycine oxidase [Solirubrobacterales bacterium]|nr:glycine oxidase [Solirubrobacterales bacterium]
MNLIRVMPAQGWLERTPPERIEKVPAQEKKTYDAIVIGAGVIGLACAWRTAERGLSVCVVERDRVGAGATGVAAGMLAPVGEATWGEEALLGLALASARDWPDFAADLERDSGAESSYAAIGALHVALDRDEAAELRRRHELHLSLGLGSEWLQASKCRELEPGLAPSCAGGLLASEEAAVDPRVLLRALTVALRERGGELIEGREVTGLESTGGAVSGVRLAGGESLDAAAVVVAAGAWSRAEWLPEEMRPQVRPVKGEIVALRGSGAPVCERIVAGERFYAVPRADGRLVVGATVEERGFDTTVTAGGVHELLRESYRALPDVAELELIETSAGLRPGSPDNAPLIGAAGDGLLLATGHYRNGVLLAPATAEAIAALVAGGEPAVDLAPFAPSRFAEPAKTPSRPRTRSGAGGV